MSIFKTLTGGVCAVLASFAVHATDVKAADKVVVSTPPIHSLVVSLLDGVDTPGLLYEREKDVRSNAVSFSQLARIEGASLVIWVGSEYEKALTTILSLDPSITQKGLTLAKTIPLHSIPDPIEIDRPTDKHDMRFWLDPKLAVMAVKRISPALVTLYPEQAERILDNEIALLAKIRKLGGEMRKAFNSEQGVPLHVASSDVLYVAWRFNLNVGHCPRAASRSEGFKEAPGGAHYFAMMRGLVGELQACREMIAQAG